MAFNRQKFLQRFAEEARENLEKISQGLLHFEQNPQDQEKLNEIFRAAHTLKGSSRMMKLTTISDTAHSLEDLFSAFREGRVLLTPSISDLIFRGIDVIRDMVEVGVVAGGNPVLDQPLCDALIAVAAGEPIATQEPVAAKKPEEKEVAVEPDAAKKPEEKEVAVEPDAAVKPEEKKVAVEPDTAVKPEEKRVAVEPVRAPSPEKPPPAPLPAPSVPAPIVAGQAPSQAIPPAVKKTVTIRISAEKLDALIRTTGEVISFQNRLKQRMLEIKQARRLSGKHQEKLNALPWPDNLQNDHRQPLLETASALNNQLSRWVSHFRDDSDLLGILFNDLQTEALGLRMLPLSTLFDTFPRLVRDVSRSVGKQVKLVMQGGDTNLDKVIIEKIGGPLMHMIRNAVDHGIESPEERQQAGKPETGNLRLTAWAEGEGIIIELADDGGGIAVEKLKNKALQKKLVSASDLESKSRSELFDLIFLPGFSTSPIITDNSGRGVGMDVVKKEILDNLKGAITIHSNPGQGSNFRIRLPLTLATIEVLLIRAGGRIFAFPKNSVREVLKVSRKEVIQVVGRQAIRVREQVLPVVGLADLIDLPSLAMARNSGQLTLLIVTSGIEFLGLIVDELLDDMEIVLKPLPYFMRNNVFASGLIISGQNEIVSVINVPSLIQITKEFKKHAIAEQESGASAQKHILVVDDSLNTREIEKEILQSYGYRVDVAQDGVDALDKAKKQPFDLIVTDVEMPRKDGFTLTEKLRETESYRYTPIIIVTSRDKEEDKQRGIQVGADAYIIKGSFDQSNLLDTVRNLSGE